MRQTTAAATLIVFALSGGAMAVAAPKVAFPPTGLDAATASAATDCTINYLPTPLTGAESKAITSNPGRAKREGGKLRVGIFELQDGGEDDVRYLYVGRYADFPIDVVSVAAFDSSGWILLDQGTRAKLEVPELPIPGQDGNTFIFPNAFSLADSGSVIIWVRHEVSWWEKWSFPTNHACDVRWINETTVGYRERSGYSTYDPGPEQRIVRGADGWAKQERN